MLPSTHSEARLVARQAELHDQAAHARLMRDARAARRARPHHGLDLDRLRALLQWRLPHRRPAARATVAMTNAS